MQLTLDGLLAGSTSPIADGPSGKQCVILLHARTLSLSRVSCEQLISRGVDLANHLGYRTDGVVKGSQAARAMSKEAKQNGYLLSVDKGGFVASLQSIGASGFIKTQPRDNIRRLLKNRGLLRDNEYPIEYGADNHLLIIELPNYFTLSFDDEPALVDDYRPGGYNYLMAEQMLNESVLQICSIGYTPCFLDESSRFEVLKFERLENIGSFERYVRHEARVAQNIRQQNASTRSPDLPTWLKKLSRKNGLSTAANAVYLLHGTDNANLGDIVREGLKTRFSLENRVHKLRYGKGLLANTLRTLLVSCWFAVWFSEEWKYSQKIAQRNSFRPLGMTHVTPKRM